MTRFNSITRLVWSSRLVAIASGDVTVNPSSWQHCNTQFHSVRLWFHSLFNCLFIQFIISLIDISNFGLLNPISHALFNEAIIQLVIVFFYSISNLIHRPIFEILLIDWPIPCHSNWFQNKLITKQMSLDDGIILISLPRRWKEKKKGFQCGYRASSYPVVQFQCNFSAVSVQSQSYSWTLTCFRAVLAQFHGDSSTFFSSVILNIKTKMISVLAFFYYQVFVFLNFRAVGGAVQCNGDAIPNGRVTSGWFQISERFEIGFRTVSERFQSRRHRNFREATRNTGGSSRWVEQHQSTPSAVR